MIIKKIENSAGSGTKRSSSAGSRKEYKINFKKIGEKLYLPEKISMLEKNPFSPDGKMEEYILTPSSDEIKYEARCGRIIIKTKRIDFPYLPDGKYKFIYFVDNSREEVCVCGDKYSKSKILWEYN